MRFALFDRPSVASAKTFVDDKNKWEGVAQGGGSGGGGGGVLS
jgi:hypothetical protein